MPELADLRESGSIEQDADLVLFIYRKGLYDAMRKEAKEEEISEGERKELRSKAKLILAKHRNGPQGVVDLIFLEKSARFIPEEKHLKQPVEEREYKEEVEE
jgi:replicative DNA helicase